MRIHLRSGKWPFSAPSFQNSFYSKRSFVLKIKGSGENLGRNKYCLSADSKRVDFLTLQSFSKCFQDEKANKTGQRKDTSFSTPNSHKIQACKLCTSNFQTQVWEMVISGPKFFRTQA